jgi:CheY-like chemotaxis protein
MRGRILYVEDEVETRSILQKLLSGEGYAVTSASSRKEAIAAAEREEFDLLIVDLGLPDGSGLELLSEVRKHQNVKGIVLSAYDIGSETFSHGYVAHVLKPVAFPRLASLIASILAGETDF